MHIKNFDPYEFSLENVDEIPVYYKNLPWAPCIHTYIVFNTGAFDDPVGKEGLSHFLEHMIFDGSPSLPDKKTIKEWSKINALNSWNAWTGFYETGYHLECLPEKYETTLEGMKDMIFNSFLKPEDVESERKVITQEAWGRFQNQKFLDYIKTCLDNIYHGHIRERFNTALGWPETISKIQQEDIDKWHKEKYVRGNFYIVLVGAVDESHIKALKNYFADIPIRKFEPKKKGLISKPKNNRFVKTADEIGEVKEQVEISIIRSMEFIPQERRWTVSALRRLLSDILHERLRIENSLCYSVNLYTLLNNDHSEIIMNVKTEEKNIEVVEKEFWKAIQEISDKKHIDRFDTIKNLGIQQVKSQERMSENIIDHAIRRIGINEGKIETLKNDLINMEKVTYDDVVNFTKKIFDPEYIFTEIILPSKK
jgi:predicted Zn-dependent peptidase